jgi:N-acetylmuramoyl-L-alanine amidase
VIIQNHRLVASSPSESVTFQLDEAGPALKPELAIVHYAVTETAGATAAVLKAKDYLSIHVNVDKAGRVIQQVPFNVRAFHAGESSYRGRVRCNEFSLGIEVANPGPVFRQPDGSFHTIYGRPWKGEVIEATHKSGRAPKTWTHWAAFSDVEFDLCCQIVDLWRAEYDIKDVVGHDDVAPGRKFDPGPAFAIKALRKAVFGFEERPNA